MGFTESRLQKLEEGLLPKRVSPPVLFIERNSKGEYVAMANIDNVLFTGTEQQCNEYVKTIAGKRTVIFEGEDKLLD